MSTLIVLGYPSEAEAKSAYQKILDLDKNLIVSLQSVAVVARRADGKYDVVTPGSKVGTSAVWGLFWGVLFGLLFFVPIVGAALGAGIGALTGAIVKHGVDKDFQDRVRNLLSCKPRCPSRTRKSSSTSFSRTSFRPPEGIAPGRSRGPSIL